MKYWEFLIQKEGDDTWLPLETQQVEILEGRYRVVAHTDRVNTPTEIRVSQLVTDEMPPRKRVRKRTSTISDSGLVVVMPFVHLKPGQWTLRCSSVNVMDDLMGEGWQYSVELQVFGETDEDWSDEWPVPTETDAVGSSLVEVDDADAGQSVDHPLVQAQATLQESQRQQGQLPEGSLSTETAYHIHLQQQAFLARPNQSMTITGQVQALVTLAPEDTASQLWLRLQNPQTAQVIMEAHRPLSLARLPADFKVKIQLPGNVSTRVVLGEVALRKNANNGQTGELLSASSFTITAGIAQLLDDLVSQDPGDFDDEVSVPASVQGVDKIEHDLSVPVLDPTHQAVSPAVGVVLPPQLDRPLEQADYRVSAETNGHSKVVDVNGLVPGSVSDRTTQQPDLPTFPKATPKVMPESTPEVSLPPAAAHPAMVSQPAQFMGTSIEDDDIEADQIAALLEDIDDDLMADVSVPNQLEPPGVEGILPEIDAASEAEGSPSAVATRGAKAYERKPQNQFRKKQDQQSERKAEVSAAFKSLKRKDRFWDRLSTLTHEGRQEASELAANMKSAGVEPKAEQSDRTPRPDYFTPVAPSNEVVIYDPPPSQTPPSSLEERSLGETSLGERAKPRRRSAAEIAADLASDISRTQITGQPSAQASLSGTAALNGQATDFATSAMPTEDLPEMALPVISVPVGNLVAGGTVTVTVRIRPSGYKPFIKLWMIDRQSRSLVGDPQLLTHLRPDALGDLEVSTDLQVPMGSLDVQIAAIAVDMATQQESNKAIVNRHVVPANQSRSSRFNF